MRRLIMSSCVATATLAMLLALPVPQAWAGPPICGSRGCVGKATVKKKTPPVIGTVTQPSRGGGGGSGPSNGGRGSGGPYYSSLRDKALQLKVDLLNGQREVGCSLPFGVCGTPATTGNTTLGNTGPIAWNPANPGGPAQAAAPAAPAVPAISPQEAAYTAVARIRFPVVAPGVGPDPDKNRWKMAAVGYPLWLWADGPTTIAPVTDSVQGLSVSLQAEVVRTTFAMGDGETVRCAGGGRRYGAWIEPGQESPTCGYRYQQPSLPDGKYTVTATAYWDVAWTSGGQSGVITVPVDASAQLPVGELQAVITG